MTRFCRDRYERCTVALGLLVSVSAKAAQCASSLCGTPAGCVTPSLVGALFFGTGDILPFSDALGAYTPLDRLMTGVAPYSDASMRL